MARPIKETPVLHGKDAEKFLEQQEAEIERSKMVENYERLRNISTFA